MPERIKQGLKEHEFFFEFQPIVDSVTRETAGLEALIRWKKEGKILSPGSFIETMMREVIYNPGTVGADYIMAFIEALEQIKGVCPNAYISFNVSIDQLTDREHAQMLVGILDLARQQNRRIVLEILETEALTSYEWKETRGILRVLQGHGASFALDDFGAGASNILRILTLPIDIIKIDKTVIDTIVEDGRVDSKRLMYLVAISDMFTACGVKKIVAEGIECKTTAEALTRAGIYLHQGFYYSKAVDCHELKNFCR